MGKDLFNDRISRFSIRKLNVGVCSVLLGTLVMVGTAASAAAEEKTEYTAADSVGSSCKQRQKLLQQQSSSYFYDSIKHPLTTTEATAATTTYKAEAPAVTSTRSCNTSEASTAQVQQHTTATSSC